MASKAKSSAPAPPPKSKGPRRPPLSDPGQDFVTVVVGPEEVRFVTHENLLVHHSPYFQAAFRRGFKEAEEKLIRFEEDDPEVFEMFLAWLYRGRLPSKSFANDNDKFTSWFDNTGLTMDGCIELYVLGDKYNVEQLRLDCISELFRVTAPASKSDLASDEALTFAFENLPDGDPMRQLLTDIYCQLANPATDPDIECAPFLASVWKRLTEDHWGTSIADSKKRKRSEKEEWTFVHELCYYHNHVDEEEKNACETSCKVAKPRKRSKKSSKADLAYSGRAVWM